MTLNPTPGITSGLYEKIINDPIHGHIRLDEVCIAVIDTPQFQRLRDLKQLGSAYYVFPGGSHNRFEHSIGVCHLAGKLVEHLRSLQPELGITDSDVKCVKIAGLCHDLGHGPFSHIFDNEFMPRARPDLKWTHEKASEDMLEYMVQENPEVASRISAEELRFIKDLIHGQARGSYPQAQKRFLFDIVANKRNSVDVDKYDYIQRDCYHVGVKSSMDTNRLIMVSRVVDNEICYNQKDVMNMYELFHTRYSLFKRVYTHKVGKAVEYMVTDLLLAADSHYQIAASVDDMSKYIHITDCLLREIERSTSPDLAKAREILLRLRKRDLYRCADMILWPAPRVEERWKKDVITVEKIVERQGEGDGLVEGDVIVEWLKLNYAMGTSNPVDSINFFNKWDMTRKYRIPREHVSVMIPTIFEETVLRVFTRIDTKRKAVQSAFRRLIAEINDDPILLQELGGSIDTWSSTPTSSNFPLDSYSSDEDEERGVKRKRGNGGESVPVTPVRGSNGNGNGNGMGREQVTPTRIPGVPILHRSPSGGIMLETSEGQTLPGNYHEISSPARKKATSRLG
ncbi:SAM domain and HD [Rhizophlyctis rosea]|uniref:SAM domain and HD n=1 Tax=Rhizophlyctis rosea TaxID=64517 RepID=A0AAD5S6K1_9FUNG|nr:SAM domain and HD [Rhizophlyctis rosea]